MMTDYDYLIKLIIIGDSGVGKSSILSRYCDDEFSINHITTIGVDFKIKTVEVNKKIIKIQIWDTAGQERFKGITTSYYRGSGVVFIVFDISDEKTFDNLKYWLIDVEKYCDQINKPIVYIVGNKNDLIRQVTYNDAKKFADTHGTKYFEVSAKNNSNINDVFNEILNDYLNLKSKLIKQKNIHISDGLTYKKNNSSCC
jgi:small GTP-binding protein